MERLLKLASKSKKYYLFPIILLNFEAKNVIIGLGLFEECVDTGHLKSNQRKKEVCCL
jgi:hypothetical protein